MKWISNLKLAWKLALSFGVCLALTALIGALAINRMGQLNAAVNHIVVDPLESLKLLGDTTDDLADYHQLELRSILVTPGPALDALEKQIADKQVEVEKDLKDYEGTVFEDEDKRNYGELKTRWAAYAQGHAKLAELCRKDDDKQATAYIMGDYMRQFEAAHAQLVVVRDWNKAQAVKLSKAAESVYASSRAAVLELLVVAIAIGMIAAYLVTRQLTSVVAQFMSRLDSMNNICVTNLNLAVDALAAGDLTAKIQTGTKLLEIDSKDEFGVMASTFNTVIKKLQATIASFEKCQDALSRTLGQVQGAAGSIATASAQVAAGNEDLSQRTEEQAASLEETAASMEQMASTVKQNADNSRHANQMAMQARTVAEKGGAVVSQAVASMEEINIVSKRIADIISVIDEIAFQTNLLALNAAVEAARVGEQGRGFAVVAAEVRTLAGRSATAAKEIKALVQDSVGKVQEGSVLVHQSGEQLEEIVTSVKRVADVIAEISAAGQEQSAGIEQVNKAVMQMDQITQQNAALVEQATAASQSMNQQADSMLETVSQFHIEARYLNAQAASETRLPSVMKATGTHGGGRPSRLSSAPRLTLTTSSAPSRTAASDNNDFEEF